MWVELIIRKTELKNLFGNNCDGHFSFQRADHWKKQKLDVAFSEIMLPENAPEWMGDREVLWSVVEKFERRKDATLAREIEVALPVEFSLEQSKALLREYLQTNFVHLGMVADYSIHDLDSHNPHAHIMLALPPAQDNSFAKSEK